MTYPPYNKHPEVSVRGFDAHAWRGWNDIITALNTRVLTSRKTVLVIDYYPGVRLEELERNVLARFGNAVRINVETARRDEHTLSEMLARNLTDDRVFGVLSCHQLAEFFDAEALTALQKQVAEAAGLVIVYGRCRSGPSGRCAGVRRYAALGNSAAHARRRTG